MTLRDQICEATDALNAIRQSYYRQQASYDDIAHAATKLLELRQQAEQQFQGKIKTKINTVAIARLIRST